jgi:hypothetical protein
MKSFLAIVLLFAFSDAFGQSIFKTDIDRFTGDTTRHLSSPLRVKKGSSGNVIIDIMTENGAPALAFAVKDPTFGCTLKDHMVKLLFDDGVSYTAYNSSEGCEGVVILLMDGGPVINKQLYYKLQESALKAVRLGNDKAYYDLDLTEADSKKLQKAALVLFGGASKGIGVPLDSTAPAAKRAILPKRSIGNQ